MNSIEHFLDSIPPIVWGTLLGSILGSISTIIGILFNNNAALARLERQLKHEALQKKIDREHNSKRVIFLETIECLEKVYFFITNIPYATSEQISCPPTASISKLNAIASEKTLQAAYDLSNFLGQTTLFLLPKKIPIADIESSISANAGIISQTLEQQKSLNNQMSTFNVEGNKDFSRFDRLQGQFKFQQDYFNTIHAEQEKLRFDLRTKQIELAKLSHELLAEGILHYCNFVKCIRDELDLPIDIESYKKDMIKRVEFTQEEFKKFILAFELEAKAIEDNS